MAMDVAELAADLEVPPSTVLEACSALGIEGAWAGAPVSAVDEVRLRARLASGGGGSSAGAGEVDVPARAAEAPEPAEPGLEPDHGVGTAPVERELESELVGVTATGAAAGSGSAGTPPPAAPDLPPTAVGSRPDLVEQFSADEAARQKEEALAGLGRTRPAAKPQADGPPTTAEAEIARKLRTPADRRLDPGIRPAVISLVIAAAAFTGGDVLDDPALILPCWLAGGVFLIIALIASNRARYRITTHPERRSGLPIALAALVIAVLGLAAFGTAMWTVLRAEPAADAPLSLGDVSSVNHMRWGFQRLRIIEDTGWKRPAKDAGTCWKEPDLGQTKPRRAHRVEVGGKRVSCQKVHLFEVVQVVSVNHDADAPFPGEAALEAVGAARCREALAALPKGASVVFEYPDEQGWDGADHDVACVVQSNRSKPLPS